MEEIIKKEELYKDKIFTVNAVKINFGNGNTGTYELIESSDGVDGVDGVMAVALDEKNNVYMIEQYQVGADKRLLVLPRGGVEKNKPPDQQMNHELMEEIGYKAKKLTRLVDLQIFPGWYKGVTILYLAQDLVKATKKGDELEDIKLKTIPFGKAIKMIQEGQIVDARTIAGLLFVKDYLQRQSSQVKSTFKVRP